jgi:23S rRNA pseudouridine2605 synthase
VASRREAEKWIQEKRVKINGKLAKLGSLFDPDSDQLTIDGKLVKSIEPPKVYWLFYKPKKYLTSRRSEGEKECIFDLPKLRKLSFTVNPVGRLDYMSEGLIILSNDGEFVYRLSHPKFKVPRHYEVLVNGRLTKDQEKQLTSGITLEDGPVKNVVLKYRGVDKSGLQNNKHWYLISVAEGRNRLVRRIFNHFDLKVSRLIRYGFGELRLPRDLKPGEYMQLAPRDLKMLRKVAGLDKGKKEAE